ncbi:unnamed protein product [Cylicocyclus nassatus]|uniref:F-box domain-containing protein n=1 Tax=Cylicocyclus nassatus TaxID=53992 RepID=A0AA36DUS6_CYLNA|nr:unnamed protein product [Cylicocyclus nassatus]
MSNNREFNKWHDLPVDLKLAILRHLPFTTLMRFMCLSKECYSLASRAKAKVERVMYWYRSHTLGFEPPCVHVSITWESVSGFGYDGYVVEIYEHGTTQSVLRRLRGAQIRYDQDFESVAVRLLVHYTKILNVRIVLINQSVMTPGFARALRGQLSTSTLQAKRFGLSTEDGSLISVLLPYLPFHSSSILISNLNHDNVTLGTDIFDHEAIRTAQEFFSSTFKADIYDEQLGKLQASNLGVRSPHITSHSINELILEWFRGERQIAYFRISTDKLLQWDDLLNGANAADVKSVVDAIGGSGVGEVLLHSKYGNLFVRMSAHFCELRRVSST